MSTRAAARLAWGMWALSVMLATAAGVLGLSGNADRVIVLSVSVSGLVFGATGALVASRVPRNSIGWIFCVLALLFEFSVFSDAYVAYGSQASGFLPASAWVGWTSQWSTNALVPALIVLCFLLFPTGSLPSARWRALVWVVVSMAAVHAASVALAPGTLVDYPIENPVGIESAGALRAVAEASILVLVIPLMLLSVVSLFVRLRRSSGAERQQLKWFAYAAALLASELVVVNGLALLGGAIERKASELVLFLVFLVVLSGIPVAMGVAILKYRLYDIDLLINRTLVYASLTVLLAAAYVGSVVGLQSVLRVLTGQESTLAIVASTLAIAALFNPLRRRVQGFVDQRFYRRKYHAAKTLESFSARLRDETDLEALNSELVSVVRETMQPAHAGLWLRPNPGPEARSAALSQFEHE
jgi:hypothetical protein